MDLVIYTGAKDRSAAAATSAADLTALEGPDDFPQLVLGTTEPITVKFVSAASSYEAWSADATYTMLVSLGALSAEGVYNLAEATLTTLIANGKSGDLALTTSALIEYFRACDRTRFGAAAVLTLQVTVTDPSGNRRAYAQIPVRVNGRVPAFPAVNPPATALTASEIAALYLVRGRGYNAQANSTGNSEVSPLAAVNSHTEVINFSGSARTSVVSLSTTSRRAGDEVKLRVNLPATSGIVVEVRNASAVGTLLTSVTSDGSGDDVAVEYVYDGSAWAVFRTSYPA